MLSRALHARQRLRDSVGFTDPNSQIITRITQETKRMAGLVTMVLRSQSLCGLLKQPIAC